MKKEYDIYCDLDGVLVDFDRGYQELTGIDLKGRYLSSKTFWDEIKKAGYDFWINLNWTSDGKHLWDYIKNYNPILLSAPSRENDSRVGKHDWVKRELPGVHLILRSAERKKEFANSKSILIDDREVNIESWVSAGGIGILHTSTTDTIKKLKELGL